MKVLVNGFRGTLVREFTIGRDTWVELTDEFNIIHKFPKSHVTFIK